MNVFAENEIINTVLETSFIIIFFKNTSMNWSVVKRPWPHTGLFLNGGGTFEVRSRLRRFEGSPIHAAIVSEYLGLRVVGVADFAGVLRFSWKGSQTYDLVGGWPSTGSDSVCKTCPELIRAPLESWERGLSNGARMSAWVVLHAEIYPFEVASGTWGTQYTSTFAPLLQKRYEVKNGVFGEISVRERSS